jgi:hypothetical protein
MGSESITELTNLAKKDYLKKASGDLANRQASLMHSSPEDWDDTNKRLTHEPYENDKKKYKQRLMTVIKTRRDVKEDHMNDYVGYLDEVSAEKLGKYINENGNKVLNPTALAFKQKREQRPWEFNVGGRFIHRDAPIEILRKGEEAHKIGADILKFKKKLEKDTKKKKTIEEVVNETLPASASAADYIHDFVHSDNKRFSGDSKQKRIRRALGAYYGKKHHVKEENIKNIREDAVEPLIGEDGKNKKKKRVKKESGPDSPIQLNKGVPNRYQNIGRDVAQSI